MQTFGHHHHHKEHVKKIIEEEDLETPAESVEYLEYVQRHQKKVEHHRRRMHRFHKILFAVGIGALGYMFIRHYAHNQRMHEEADETIYAGRNHRLGASNDTAQANAYGSTFSAMSVAIWGLVIAKAKTGMDVSSKNDASSVGGLVKKIGTICTLIAAASLCQFMGSSEASVAVSQPSTHKLQASSS